MLPLSVILSWIHGVHSLIRLLFLENGLVQKKNYTVIATIEQNPKGEFTLVSTLEGSVSSVGHMHLAARLTSPVRFVQTVKTTPTSSLQNIGYNLPADDTRPECVAGTCDGTRIGLFLAQSSQHGGWQSTL